MKDHAHLRTCAIACLNGWAIVMVRARAPGSGGDVPTRRLDDERQHAGRFCEVLVRQHGASSDIHARRTAIAGGADQCERDKLRTA